MKTHIRVTIAVLDIHYLVTDNIYARPVAEELFVGRFGLDEMTEADIPVVVVSNNKYERVERAVANFHVDFVSRAMKPFTKGINEAIERYHFNRDEVVMVGDQLMTDIRASHRAGIRSILVKPLVKSDAWVTKFNRWRERRMWKKIEKAYGPMTFNKGI